MSAATQKLQLIKEMEAKLSIPREDYLRFRKAALDVTVSLETFQQMLDKYTLLQQFMQ